MSYRFSKIDRLILQSGQHFHLDLNDDCYFFGEYTARRGYSFSETNQLILNLKKGMERVSLPDFRYKTRAIKEAATIFRECLTGPDNIQALRSATLVPIPPSKAKGHSLYDDRILKILQEMDRDGELDIRELIMQITTLDSFHGDNRLPPDSLAALYQIDESQCEPSPSCIWLFDDVITTGSHFKAAKQVLLERFPGITIVGIFVARRVPEADNP